MTRFVDRGAIVAAYVGIGMALVIAVSFLLVIPIEPAYWLLAPLSGLLIGYYADARSDRRSGPWRRILGNGLFAGLVTGLALALVLLAVKALFFTADNGFRDPRPRRPVELLRRCELRLCPLPGPGRRRPRPCGDHRRDLVHVVLLEPAARRRPGR